MLKRFFLVVCFFVSVYVSAQGTFKGKVVEKDTIPLAFATVRLMQKDTVILETTTDVKGNYVLNAIPSGKYDIKISYAGYPDYTIENIEIHGTPLKIFDDVEMATSRMKPPYMICDDRCSGKKGKRHKLK